MAPSLPRIAPLRPPDIPAVLGLARSLGAWFNRQGLEEMERDLPVHRGWIARADEGIAGFATWHPLDGETAELSWMGVALARQRQGLGTALLGALSGDARAEGRSFLQVCTVADSVDYPPYERTRRFYRSRGFADHRVDPGFYGEAGDRYDRLVLLLDLRAGGPSGDVRPPAGA